MIEKVEVTLARLEERIGQLQDEVRHVHKEVMVAIGGIVGTIAHLFLGWVK
jgi:hypothetical protein